MFEFSKFEFDFETYIGSFIYRDQFGTTFCEKVHFIKNGPFDRKLVPIFSEALRLLFVLIGTSYYKAHPTKKVSLPFEISGFQKKFFNTVYTDGLSQFAYENNLKPSDLADFSDCNTSNAPAAPNLPYALGKILSLQSGGKDSILTATILESRGKDFESLYIGSTDKHPEVIDKLGAPVKHILREVDIDALKEASKIKGYKNGHVPVTYILMGIALVQAIIDGDSYVITSVGHEGEEPHSVIKDAYRGDLKVNHQWSKTYEAELLFSEYVHTIIARDFEVGSILRAFSELKIAELFSKSCFNKYGHDFSSCNVANYRQKNDNSKLSWCANCAKCANSFLIFAPFVKPEKLIRVFGEDLFSKKSLTDDFKGLLGIGKSLKPFECVGEIAELREAYAMKLDGYADLPFNVPKNQDYDYQKTYPVQDFAKKLLAR